MLETAQLVSLTPSLSREGEITATVLFLNKCSVYGQVRWAGRWDREMQTWSHMG